MSARPGSPYFRTIVRKTLAGDVSDHIQRSDTLSGRRLALRLGAGLAGLTTIASLGLAAPQAASASGFLPTTTTVTSGGAFADVPGIRVPLSAQVALLAPLPLLTKTGVGLILTPSSSVYFTVSGPGL